MYDFELCYHHFLFRIDNYSINQPTMKTFKIQSVSNKFYWYEAYQSQTSNQFEGGNII